MATGVRIATCVRGADVRLAHQPMLQARDREVLADETVLGAGAYVQDANVLTGKLSGSFCPVEDLLLVARVGEADAAAEERVDDQVAARFLAAEAAAAAGASAGAREVEERRAVEEEVALLRVEQREARQVYLPLIDLGLCEVGVDRQVRAQRRRRIVKEVDARIAGAVHVLL